MKATFVLLADMEAENYGRKYMLEANRVGNVGFEIGGGHLLSTFINEKLVDEIIITIAPVLLGKGIPLFNNNSFQTPLLLKSINRYNQFVELRYEVVR